MNNEVIPNIVWAIKIIKKGEVYKDAITYIYIYNKLLIILMHILKIAM